MPRIVRGGLIQASLATSTEQPIEKIKQAMIDKHVKLIEEAGEKGVQRAASRVSYRCTR